MLTNTKGERKKYLMDNFIKIYPNIIPNEICEYLIDFFNHQDFVGNTHEGKSGGSVQKQIKDCTDLQINLNGKNKFDISNGSADLNAFLYPGTCLPISYNIA